MRRLRSMLLAFVAVFGGVAPALGGVAESISVTVVPVLNPAVATYSAPVTGFDGTVGYKVDIRNVGKNRNNSVRFTAQSYVTDALEFGTYDFDSTEGASCTASKGPVAIAIECELGTLSSGQSYPTFYLFFKTPVFVANGIADELPNDFVTFNYQVFYAEGGNGPKSTPRNGFTALTAATPTVLGTPDPTLVRSVVLAGGGTIFTGNQGIANASTQDIHATKAVVPLLPAHTTAEILEAGTACTSSNVFTCYTSQITIPGTFSSPPYLTTRLSQAIQNIRKQTVPVACSGSLKACTSTTQLIPIEQIVIKYLADATAVDPNPIEQIVALCAPIAGPPPASVPCITSRTVVNDNLTGKPVRYEWTLISTKNGRLAID